MRTSFLKAMLVCILVAPWMQASAGGLTTALEDYRKVKTEGKTTTLIGIDNDSLLLTSANGLYTNGTRIGQRHTMQDAAQSTTFGWRFGQEIYTPTDIELAPAEIGPTDHPYAGWLYGGFFKELHRVDGTHTKLGFDLGCLGPCSAAQWAQTASHRLLKKTKPQGWSQQVRNEWGMVLYADAAPLRWTARDWIDLAPNFHGRFGNIHTDAGAGLTVRAGRLPLFPDQPTLHGFLRIDGRVVAYNATLQGGYFSRDNPHTVQPRRLVAEAELGLAWMGRHYGLRASVVRRGNEIRDLSNAIGVQNFARLQFSYTP